MTNSTFRELVRAVANGDTAEAQRLDSQIGDDRESYHTYVTVFFGATLAERFAEDQSHEAVMRFVDQLAQAYRTMDPPFNRVALELVVRGFLGEEELFESVSADEQLHVQLLGIRAITDQVEKVRENFDSYLNDTDIIMAELAE